MKKYPMLINSVFKDYLWGGTRLRDEYGKQTELDPVAESWELSCHRDGPATIANGDCAGMVLAEYVAMDKASVLGKGWNAEEDFPILVKFIDAKNPLSVQVHPDDSYARVAENDNGKAEVWLVLAAEPGASLVYGVNRELSRDEFAELIRSDRLDEVLNRISVQPGDVVFVPPGTLHAIGGGLLIAEVQQSSNATYRVWDYGRVGADGKPRPLHIEKTLDVAKLYPTPVPAIPGDKACGEGWQEITLAHCEYFTVRRLELDGSIVVDSSDESFEGITCIEGQCVVSWSEGSFVLKAGNTMFVPAGTEKFTLSGKASLLRSGR